MTTFVRRLVRIVLAAGLLAAVGGLAAGCGVKFPKPNVPVQLRANVLYGRSNKGRALREDVYIPRERTKPAALVIVIHGGGFTHGDKKTTDQYSSALASDGFVTANVNYSLRKPGYPEQVKEIQRAIRWNIAHAAQFGADPRRVGLVGFSNGGYLAAMGGVLESGLPGRPIKAVVTLSAPLDFSSLFTLLRHRIEVCGFRRTCPQLPQTAPPASFGSMLAFLGCPTGRCSGHLYSEASPSSHVTSRSPAFLMFNSAHEVTPPSQPADMAKVLRASRVQHQVVIVPGHQHDGSYVPSVSSAIFAYLGEQLRISPLRLAIGNGPRPPSGSLTVLVVCCVLAAAVSLILILAIVQRRTARRRLVRS